MKFLLTVLLLLSLAACTPKPPIFIVTKSSTALEAVKTGKLGLGQVQKVELNDFKRAFVKKYGDEANFLKGFHGDLTSQLEAGGPYSGATFRIELPLLNVDNYVETHTMMVGGGPNMPGHMTTTHTEYCVIKLDYQVKAADGSVVMEGRVQERTAKGEFLHPNQSKLANAVSGVQKHLVDYLRGRMALENIQNPEPPAKK